MQLVKEYFETARERYQIKLRREQGQEWPWTSDPIYREWRFCNVHREDDKTTTWFRDNVRSQLTDPLALITATLIFRWFNRIETGEIIKDLLLEGWNEEEARKRLQFVRPLVTGAYMIKTVDGMDKLEGALWSINAAMPMLPSIAEAMGDSIEHATMLLSGLSYIGPFMAYEIASDLRWTPVLSRANDIMSWANPGPGCARGIGRVVGGDPKMYNRCAARDIAAMNIQMREILAMSQTGHYWPASWRQWEMREVEHWSCEFDKYSRAMEGERLKRRYS